MKNLAGLVAAAGFLLAGCSTPCTAPGRLCAPVEANASARPAVAPAAPVPAETSVARAAPTATTRIALLLPLQSDQLGAAAEAVQAGFMAAWHRERAGVEVDLIVTGDSPDDALQAYSQAAAHDDIIVGPLARPAVDALAAAGVGKPTVALNHPSQDSAVPAGMLVIGLSIEDEARQAAQWAAREHAGARALVIGGPSPWQKRATDAFDDQWTQLGNSDHRVALAPDGATTRAALDELKNRIQVDPPDLLFAALDAAQLREVRAALGTTIPCYATSAANPGKVAAPELDGVRLLDLPWELHAAQGYPAWTGKTATLDMDRLYALGIDAFRVARELAQHPGAPVRLDGVTGRLKGDGGHVERLESAVVYRDGTFEPVP